MEGAAHPGQASPDDSVVCAVMLAPQWGQNRLWFDTRCWQPVQRLAWRGSGKPRGIRGAEQYPQWLDPSSACGAPHAGQ